MIALWMAYAVLVALLLGLAAGALERAFTLHGRSVRWVWGSALAASWIVPVVTWVTAPVASETRPAATGTTGGAQAVDPATFLALLEQAAALRAAAGPGLESVGDVLLVLWAGLAVMALALFGLAVGRVVRESRRWPEAALHGDRVRVSADFGPAVVGVRRPSIVLPRWIFSLEESAVRMVLRHEQEHRSARDTLLLTAGVILVLAAPWNLPLWWHLRRLRMAVELDCDRRVLRSGISPRRYGDLLLEVGKRLGRTTVPVAALAEPPSFLERRLKMIAEKKTTGRGWKSTVAAGLAVSLLAVACETPAPTRPDDSETVKVESSSGLPDADQAVIRAFGGDLPLVLVDGEEWTAELTTIDPSTIASIEVVKGAAAEGTYGERAAGGAVSIRTKGHESSGGTYRAVEIPEGAEPVTVARATESPDEVPDKMPFTVEKVELEEMPVPISSTEEGGETLSGGQWEFHAQPVAGEAGEQAGDRSGRIRLVGPATSSSPLVIVDGVITDHGLAEIASLDVKSIEVVKGAAAKRLYGEQSRAANGVVLITTKRVPRRP